MRSRRPIVKIKLNPVNNPAVSRHRCLTDLDTDVSSERGAILKASLTRDNEVVGVSLVNEVVHEDSPRGLAQRLWWDDEATLSAVPASGVPSPMAEVLVSLDEQHLR